MLERKATMPPSTVFMGPEVFGQRDDTAIYWLTGGGFLVNSGGTVILIDPTISYQDEEKTFCETGVRMLIPLPITADQIERADAILYTHSDADHCGPISPKLITTKTGAKSYGPPPVYEKLMQMDISWRDAVMCRSGDSYPVGQVTVRPVSADHPHQYYDRYLKVGNDKVFREGDCVGYMLDTKDGVLFFPGDTRLMEYHLFLKDQVDVLALDVSFCNYHLSPEGAVVLADAIPNAYLLPCHYGSYDEPKIPGYYGDPNVVLDAVKDGRERGRILPPGEPFVIRDKKEKE